MSMNEPKHDKALFENAPILKTILKFALPTVAGQIILVIYNMADTFFIGLTGSDAKVTAVTVCMPAFMFLSAISNLFGVGGSSVIARSLGIGQHEKASLTSAFSLWGCTAVTVLYALGVLVWRRPFVTLLGAADPEVEAYAAEYLMWTVVAGGLGTALNTLLGHLVRSEGKSSQASVGIMLGGICNILLDPLFMFVLLPEGQETLGAAIATMISNYVAMIYFMVLCRKNRSRSVLRFRPQRGMLGQHIPSEVLSTGLPACLMTLLENISYAVLDNLMSAYGMACQSGLGIAKKVNMLAHSMVRGMSQGVLPLIAYNYSAKNNRRMRQSVLISMSISVSLALACMLVSLLFNRELIRLFIPQGTDSITHGAAFLRVLCVGCPFSACAYGIISFFQATGKCRRSFLLTILRKGLLDIPLMFLLDPLVPVIGIVSATPVTDIICCGVAVVLLFRFLQRHPVSEKEPCPVLGD